MSDLLPRCEPIAAQNDYCNLHGRWLGHCRAEAAEARAPLEAEIARLRRIEEAARRLIRENDMDRGIGFIRALDALRAALEEKP